MAGPYYVDSGAGGSDTGEDWTNAFLTLLQATAVATNGDTIYVKHDHAESQAGALTLTGPSAGAPVFIVSASGTGTAYQVASNAQVTVSGNANLAINGCFSIFGVSFKSGNSVDPTIEGDEIFLMDSCTVEGNTVATGNNPSPIIGNGQFIARNCTFKSGITATGGSVLFLKQNVTAEFYGCTFTATTPSYMTVYAIETEVTQNQNIIVNACDFSGLTSLTAVLEVTTGPGYVRFDGNNYPSGVSPFGTLAAHQVDFMSTRGGTVPRELLVESYNGDINDSTTYTLNASDGTAYSWLITTTANNSVAQPIYTPWVSVWVPATGSKTFKVELTSATTFTDSEVWLETEYQAATTSSATTLATTRNADILAAGTNLVTTGVGTWSVTDKTEQKIEDTLTVNTAGLVRCRLGVAKASVTDLYFDPYITVT